MAYKSTNMQFSYNCFAYRCRRHIGKDTWGLIMEVAALDIIKIKGFLRQYVEVLRERGKASDSYAVDVIEDLLTRL